VNTEDTFIVDVDAHYTDSLDDLQEYLDDDDPWKRRMDTNTPPGRYPFPQVTDTYINYERQRQSARTREDIAEIMDTLDFDAILMISNWALMFPHMNTDDQRQWKFSKAYTERMLDRIVDADQGIYMAAPIPHQDPQRGAEIIDMVKDEKGVVAGCFATGMPEPPLGNRRYDPIYKAAEKAGLPLVFHGSGGSMDHFKVSGFSSPMAGRMLGFIWANTAQLTSLIAQGVPEKYPGIDFVFQESGIFYLPMMMYRMDGEYLRASWDAPLLEKRPSEYMKEMYFGTQPLEYPPDDEYFKYVIEMIGGADRLMYASDYPHVDYDEPSSILDMPHLSSDDKRKIMGGNAREVFEI
jgi:predicted TIM-barrel fold metal-dependent hydrolase